MLKLNMKLVYSISLVFTLSLVLPINIANASTNQNPTNSKTTASSPSFDRSLASISKQFKEKDYQKVLTRLPGLTPSEELKDIYLFLKAESLKNLKRNQEAIKVYEEITTNYPKTEIGKQCFMPLYLLKLEATGIDETASLEDFAKKMPTAWQSGRALEKLHNLPYLMPNKKSRYALLALRQYSRGALFYSKSSSTCDLLKQIWENSDNYEFLAIEWFEILKITCKEELLGLLFKKGKQLPQQITKLLAPEVIKLFNGCWLCSNKQYKEGIALLTEIANNQKVLPEIRIYAIEQRALALINLKKYAEALVDCNVLCSSNDSSIDKLAAEYYKMRCLFYLKKDEECINCLKNLIKGKRINGLLSTKIYEMGLECYDIKEVKRSVKYFKLYENNFIGHHRADDALGYAVKALGGIKTAEGSKIYSRLKKNYTNSFYLYWLEPSIRTSNLKYSDVKLGKLTDNQHKKIKRLKKLWPTDFIDIARAEGNALSETNPRDFTLYKALIDLAAEFDDYKQVCGYGERLARQILEANKSLDEMPKWAWEAMYPRPWNDLLKMNAKKFSVEIEWIRAIMREESHFDPLIKSRSNAISLMQILPSTGKWIAGKLGEKKFKESMLWDKETNIKYGTWYLRYLYDMFNREKILATAAYNGGQGSITRKVQDIYPKLPVWERIDKVPMSETRDYFKKVGASYFMYKRLYK